VLAAQSRRRLQTFLHKPEQRTNLQVRLPKAFSERS
jgi:hypothetical protein